MTNAETAGLAALLAMVAVWTLAGWRRELQAYWKSRRRLALVEGPAPPPKNPLLRLSFLRWQRWQRSDAAAALHLRLEEYWGLNALIFLGGFAVGWALRGFIGGFLLGVAALAGAIWGLRWRRQQWLNQAEQQLPDLLRAVATALRAGSSLNQALNAVGRELADPLGTEIRRLGRREALGFGLSETLSELAERVPSRDLEIAIAAIQVQREVGGSLAPLLENVVETVEARQRLKAEVRVLTAMGRASGVILSLLPVGLGLMVWFMNPSYMDLLFTTGIGHILVAYGVGSLIVGSIIINRLVREPEL
jgi:tight adherence protein B